MPKKVFVTAGVAIAMVGGIIGLRQWNLARSADRDAEYEADRATIAQKRAQFDRALNESPVERRIHQAQATWDQFDRLSGDQFRTAAMLQAHRLQADQGLDLMPDDEAAKVRAFNARQFRSRLPTVMVPGELGTAAGADLSMLVPSSDPGRCAKLGATWAKPPIGAQLAGFGFTSIRCPGGETWALK